MKLFDNALMTVNLLGLLHVWGELLECYYGVNGFGSDTAEIYAFQLTRYSPLVHGGAMSGEMHEAAKEEYTLNAANALCSIVEEFCTQYDCEAEIDGIPLGEWCALCNMRRHVFDHRCRVRIIKTEKVTA